MNELPFSAREELFEDEANPKEAKLKSRQRFPVILQSSIAALLS